MVRSKERLPRRTLIAITFPYDEMGEAGDMGGQLI